ncbi:DUF1049 domain-containing protein [Mycoplana rhizolycopersici]|jgi:uncharacterized integral membrane protein|uniref:DUF1049 domain-containing protein n=1 Tax=Mycoplana rhizolycopersici TaxID=2746702 RepID=A0ABX2QAM5_9HYPH|nr:DUF1049 domain-containing protein [Rhizobium rhizolycopersici]NVP54787.1 DUF1049 domain-containing protein [Rhizobium rhizolycopersici]
MLKKIVNLVVLVPIGIVLIVLSVANRQPVRMALNPFRPEDSLLSMTAPFFVFLFLALLLGMIIGAVATWVSQHKYRKRARVEATEAVKWQTEADKQKTRAETLAAQSLLSAPK